MALLTNKTAIVTGASSGIGRAIAVLFARQGASIVLNGRDAGALAATQATIESGGGVACIVAGDVGDEDTHRAMATAATERFGALHIAVNNAGIVGAYGRLEDIDLDDWHHGLRTNVTGALLGARSQIPAMRAAGGGSILFVSSFVGTSVGLPGMAAYGTTKAALMGLVKGITADHGAEGIRANALLPGGTDTPAAGTAEQKQWAAGLHALQRIAQPEEIAQAALFLASDMSSFVAGSALYADGGNAAVK